MSKRIGGTIVIAAGVAGLIAAVLLSIWFYDRIVERLEPRAGYSFDADSRALAPFVHPIRPSPPLDWRRYCLLNDV